MKIKEIMENQHLSSHKRNVESFGSYIHTCIRHAIAHIQRKRGKSLSIDSLKELRHLDQIKNALQEYALFKMKNIHKMEKPDSLEYLSYFDPDATP